MCGMDASRAPKIGKTIKRARERKRMSQAEAAAALGVSRSALNAWENDRAYPRSSIGAIEELYGISLDGEPEPEPELPPSLMADIYRTFPDEEGRQRAIRLFRRTLAEGIPAPPSAGEPPEQGRRAGL